MPKMVDERRLSLIKTDISGIPILKNIFVKIEFCHFTLPLENGNSFSTNVADPCSLS